MSNILTPSNSRKITGILFSFIIFISYITLHAQSLSVFDIDQSAFPKIRAKFYAFDSLGNQIKNLSPSDFVVKEDGVVRKVTAVSCPEAKTPEPVSVAMSVDVSETLINFDIHFQLELRSITAKRLVDAMTGPPSEIALLDCAAFSFIMQDFTTDTSKIKRKLEYGLDLGGNDFIDQLLNPYTGLLNIVKTGKNKRVAIIFTDASYPALKNEITRRCIDTCKKYDISFYAVIYNYSEFGKKGIKSSFQTICDSTGGRLYDGIIDAKAANEVAYALQKQIQSVEACDIEWESGYKCNGDNIYIDMSYNGIGVQLDYKPVGHSIADVKISPFSIDFRNRDIGVPVDTAITIKAMDADIRVSNIISNNPAFVITPQAFFLEKGHSRTLNLRFTPTDSNYTFAEFDVLNNTCTTKIYAGGGFKDKRIKKNPLRLTFPNSRELFYADDNTNISWEGILSSDTVCLELSSDYGYTWHLITDIATGLKYNWKVPRLDSKRCFIRISTNLLTNDTMPVMKWQKCFGGKSFDEASSLIKLDDSTFIVAGYTSSIDGDVLGNHGGGDAWLIKLNQDGQIQWQKCFGGSSVDAFTSIKQTQDKGFIITGSTQSDNGDVSGCHIDTNFIMPDCWIVKLDKLGNIEWQKCLGGSLEEFATEVIELKDGGYLVGGMTRSNDGDVSGNHGDGDAWIVKLDQSGRIIWQKCLGGSDFEIIRSIIETKDNGYIVAVNTNSNDGDVSGNHGKSDIWLVKLNKDGNTLWQKCFGGDSSDGLSKIIETTNGGYLIAGGTNSNNGDVSGNHGGYDEWILKLDSNFQIKWQKCLGSTQIEGASSVIETSDGGFIITGNTDSNYVDQPHYSESNDLWLIKIGRGGEIIWSKIFDYRAFETGNSMIKMNDGYFVVGGTQNKNLPDNHGDNDLWVAKLDLEGVFQQDLSDTAFSIITPFIDCQSIDFGGCSVGAFKHMTITDYIKIFSDKIKIDSVYIEGPDAESFNIVSYCDQPLFITSNKYPAELEFKPEKEGRLSASIVFVTQYRKFYGYVKGEGIKSQLEILENVIDFGNVKVGKDSVRELTIKNKSTSSLNFINVGYARDFESISDLSKMVLKPGETGKIDLRFKPVDFGRTNDVLKVDYRYINSMKGGYTPVPIFGTGVKDEPESVEKESETELIKRSNMLKSIYPNPSKSEITIKYELSEKNYTHIYITNILGERVKDIISENNTELGEQTIKADLSDLSLGTYFIILQTMNGSTGRKIEIIR